MDTLVIFLLGFGCGLVLGVAGFALIASFVFGDD